MSNSLLPILICTLIAYHSVALPGFEFPDYQQGLLSGFDFSFGMLKQDYLTRISKLKREVIECSSNGDCLDIVEKIKLLNELFRHDAEKMKDLQKQSMQMFHRRNYIRCLDCIVDYIDEMINEFCYTMDSMQEEFNGIASTASITPPNASPAGILLNQPPSIAATSPTILSAKATVAVPTQVNVTS